MGIFTGGKKRKRVKYARGGKMVKSWVWANTESRGRVGGKRTKVRQLQRKVKRTDARLFRPYRRMINKSVKMVGRPY